MSRFFELALEGNRVVLDTAIGHLRELSFSAGGRSIAPLHTAPWVTDAPIAAGSGVAPTEQGLSGDFLCAPFCASDVEPAPIHGWTANAPWTLVDSSAGADTAEARFELSRDVFGATVRKRLRFRAGEPFLYIDHSFAGGQGTLPIGHHAMIHVDGQAALSFSPKGEVLTPAGAPEPDASRGRSLLTYPYRGPDLHSVPLAAGGSVDLGTYPYAERHEDLAVLVEAAGATLGWTAALRERENDIVLLLKDARVFPLTAMWMSNGGRDYEPWNSRHIGVLGLEDIRAFGTEGHRASIEPNFLSDAGVPTAFDLSTPLDLRYAIGAVAKPDGWSRIADIHAEPDSLVIADSRGETLTLRFDADWLLGGNGG